MRSATRRLVLLALVLAGRVARADEPPKPPPAAPVPKGAPLIVPGPVADAVLASIRAKDDAALTALAAKDDPEPWVVADELIRRGEFDAAAAFAKAAPRPDLEALPRYVEALRGHAPETAERELLAARNEAAQAGTFEKALEGAFERMDTLDTVTRVRLETARGRALAKLSRWAESSSVERRAADAALALGWLRRASELYDGAAYAASQASDWARSLECLETLLPLRRRRGDEHGAAVTLGQIGFDREQTGDHVRGLAAYEEALARFQALKDEEQIAWMLWNISFAHRDLGEHAKEIEALEGAMRAQEARGNTVGAYDALNLIGIAWSNLGDHDKALSVHEQALARGEAAGDKARIAGSLVNLGNERFALGDVPGARGSYERGLALAEEVGQQEWAANALRGLARMYRKLGEHAKALALYQDLRERCRSRGDEAGAAHWSAFIGAVNQDRGDYAKALAAYEQALAAQERLGLKLDAAHTLDEIGLVHHALGDFAKALSVSEEVLARMETLKDKAGQSAALINMGGVYRSLGDLGTSLALYQRGLAVATEIGHRQWKTNALANIGNLYLDTGQPAQALGVFETVLEEDEALKNRRGAALALANIGAAYNSLGQPDKAVEVLERALEAEEALGEKAAAIEDLFGLGLTYMNLGNRSKAHEFLDRSTDAARSRRLAPLLMRTLTLSADTYLQEGNASRALRDAGEALQVAEGLLGGLGDEQGASARAQYASLFGVGALAALREKDPAALLKFLESGRAGALLDGLDQRETLRWKAESLPPDLRRLDLEARAKERAARDAYDVASRGGDREATREAGKVLDEAIDAARIVVNRIQRELKQAALFYPRARTIDDVRSSLRPDQALVIYGLCQDEALALVLRHGGVRAVPLGKAADVRAACEALDAKDQGVDPTPALDALRKRLVEPLALEEDAKQVLVSPEGPLCYLPFALLFSQAVAMTPSGSTHVLLLDEEGERGRGILALGDPDYAGVSEGAKAIYQRGRPLTALPATRDEAAAIGTRTLLGAEASETKFLEVLPSSTRWRAIHFACHGLVNTDKPMLSSLALTRAGDADGFFTALEVLRTKIPADLVVLSACETATGKIVNGEGIVGLARAFMFAGTPRVICSLWKVDDEATRALMVKFYELWNPKDGKPGLPTADALRKAQEFVKSQEKWKHPYYWAAWVLWGLPS